MDYSEMVDGVKECLPVLVIPPACLVCKGVGSLRNESEQFTCPYCNGEGYIKD